MNGRGKSATVIDAQSGKVVATIPLGGKPESAQADSKAGKVYVNIEDKNAIKVIDMATHKVTATWPIAPGEAASGMAIDVDNHRLFIGCDNKLMLMVDATNGKVVYSVPIGAGVDSNWFDPATKLAFARTAKPAHHDRARRLADAAESGPDAEDPRAAPRTMALDPIDAHDLPGVTEYEPQAAGARGSRRKGARHVKVLVVARSANEGLLGHVSALARSILRRHRDRLRIAGAAVSASASAQTPPARARQPAQPAAAAHAAGGARAGAREQPAARARR